ncbi:MAG: DUF1156 domain-containing protein [Agathobacter sp.]|nr:DUF1156 domain-containing protein [Agathobacter sp.]
MGNKKLIEVALPLEQMNAASEYEKMPGIGPHPRGIHHWWARRPFTTARAIIWASIIDDPSSNVDAFPTEEAQAKERKRLFDILIRLADWKNSNDESVINAAKDEILKATNNNPPVFLDPFSGGGAIPFEASRLGLKTFAHDLNPVAVMINKAMIEIPIAFSGNAPINENKRAELGFDQSKWEGVTGLTEDILYYGEHIKKKAFETVGSMYPKVLIPSEQGGGETTAVAWIWTRTVKCPNPTCGSELPLLKSYVLSSKKGREAYIQPVYENGRLSFEVENKKYPGKKSGTVSRSGVVCPCCNSPVEFEYVREEGKAGRLSARLAAVVAEGRRSKMYLSPTIEQEMAAKVDLPDHYPAGAISYYPGCLNTNAYGLNQFEMLFSNRQMQTLVALSDALKDIKSQIEEDAVAAGMKNDHIALSKGGTGARAYSEAIAVYLAFSIDRVSNFSNTVTKWAPTNEKVMFLFSRQAISMTWDYPEANIFGNSVGSFTQVNEYIADCIKTFPKDRLQGTAVQADAQTDCGLRNIMISTDPPYYDNVPYADLSDFFYIWLRYNIKDIYPELFGTMLTPKNEEIVAQRYRFDGDIDQAKNFFEEGMLQACRNMYLYATDEIPVTIYYAYKQSETEDNGENQATASSGWETMLSAIIKAGFTITGTWPVRTEMIKALKTNWNALASSIVLVCRKRGDDAPQTTRRNFVNALRKELRPALRKLQESNIAPVDLAQSAIGPGMGVYSRYSKVLESDGSEMSVRSALQIINQELDLFFNEQDGDLDRDSRFCVDVYSQYAFNDMKFGEADTLARAKNTSVATMAASGILFAQKGTVHLLERKELTEKVDSHVSTWLLCQQLTRAMENGGIEACATLISNMYGSEPEKAKDLAYRLYTISERKGWSQESYAYNALVVSWPEIQSRAATIQAMEPKQMSLFDLV